MHVPETVAPPTAPGNGQDLGLIWESF